MENKDSALLRQIKGGLQAYLMIGLSDTGSEVESSFGLYDKNGEEIEGDVLDLLTYIWLTYRYVADSLDIPVEKVHELVGQALENLEKHEQAQEGTDIND